MDTLGSMVSVESTMDITADQGVGPVGREWSAPGHQEPRVSVPNTFEPVHPAALSGRL